METITTQLLGLTVLSIMGLAIAFMVMTMASGLESRAMTYLGIDPSANAASGEFTAETIEEIALQEQNSSR